MKVIGFLLVTMLASCLAAKQLDLDAIEKELKAAPLVDVQPEMRFRFFNWFNKACKCTGIKCGCCASPKIFGVALQGCIQFTLNPQEKSLGIELTALNKQVFNKQFPTQLTENVCGYLPGRASFLGYCFRSEISGNEQEGVKVCSLFDVKVKSVTAVSVSFRCIKLQDGKLSFDESSLDSENSIFKVKARDPFKKVVEWIKKKKN